MYLRVGQIILAIVPEKAGKNFKTGDAVQLEDNMTMRQSPRSFSEGIIIEAGQVTPEGERYPIHRILTNDDRIVEFNGAHLVHLKCSKVK